MAERHGLSPARLDVDRLVASVLAVTPADQIILFGSYARGQQTPESDVDIMVIADDSSARTLGDIRFALSWLPMHVDVLTETRARLSSARDKIGSIEHEIAKEGIVLYGRS